MNIQPNETGTKIRLNRIDTIKLHIQAHIECAPALMYRYWKKIKDYVGVGL